MDIASTSFQGNLTVLDIVTYSDKAAHLQFTRQNYESRITQLKAGGTTSFVAAMDKVDEVMKQRTRKYLFKQLSGTSLSNCYII